METIIQTIASIPGIGEGIGNVAVIMVPIAVLAVIDAAANAYRSRTRRPRSFDSPERRERVSRRRASSR